ncbi:MAG: oxidoreductase [Steroidobacteraceae bacterium]
MHRSLNAALVGYGYAGRTFHAPLLAATPGIALAAVASGQRERLAHDYPHAAVLPLPDLLARPDIDFVVVATPNATHFELARAALNAGKHVVVDKPFTLTVGEAEELVELAKRLGLILTVFHNRRWDGDFLTLKRLVEGGELGNMTSFESRFDRYRPEIRDRWRERNAPGSGTWFDLGPHLVDQALMLFGLPLGIKAELAIERPGACTIDRFDVTLRYATLRVVLASSYLATAPGPRFHAVGTAGSYLRHGEDSQEHCLREGRRPGGDDDWGLNPEPGLLIRIIDDCEVSIEIPTERGRYASFYRALADAVAGLGPPPVDTADMVNVMRVLELAVVSAERGLEVTLA